MERLGIATMIAAGLVSHNVHVESDAQEVAERAFEITDALIAIEKASKPKASKKAVKKAVTPDPDGDDDQEDDDQE